MKNIKGDSVLKWDLENCVVIYLGVIIAASEANTYDNTIRAALITNADQLIKL